MPISKDELVSTYVVAPGHATFGQAMAALNAAQGQRWWHLVVHKADGSWATATFNDVLLANAQAGMGLADTPLENLPGLKPADSVEQTAMGTNVALDKARSSESGALIVTEGEHPVGLIATTQRSAENPTDFAKLNQLAGQFVNLKDYGDVLLPPKKKK
ncbi:MAG: hypothetical protein HY260_13650 [Chloroflexi bacterium]|nr:hypothetical protein [Chloroflexota bacterium]